MGIRNAIKTSIHQVPLLANATNYLRAKVAFVEGTWRGSFAQHREDLFVLDYFKGRTGTYIDVGANHPIKLSSTYLLYQKGWKGLTIEPIPFLSVLHQKLRKEDIHLNAAVGNSPGHLTFFEMIPDLFSTFDEVRAMSLVKSGMILRDRYQVNIVTLADVYKRYLNGQKIDLLSIDTELFELLVLQGNDWLTMRPQLIICENGLSEEIKTFLQSVNYHILKNIGCNSVFERDE